MSKIGGQRTGDGLAAVAARLLGAEPQSGQQQQQQRLVPQQ